MSNYIEQLEEQNAQLLHKNALMEKKIFELEQILVRDIHKDVDNISKERKDLIKYMSSLMGAAVVNTIVDKLVEDYKAQVNQVILDNYNSGKYE